MEPRIVSAPVMFPSACAFCGTAHGPVIDTGIERPGIGLLYICVKLCAPAIARAAGLVEGDRMEQLLAASNELGQAEVGIAERENELGRQRDTIAILEQAVQYREQQLDQERGRIAVFLQLAESLVGTVQQIDSILEQVRLAEAPATTDEPADDETDDESTDDETETEAEPEMEPVAAVGPPARVLTGRHSDEDDVRLPGREWEESS